MGTAAAPNPVPLTVNGTVHGGQQAVTGATIQLYVAGNAGNGSAASSLLNTAVTSDSNGMFSITGDYSCPSSTSQVYLVATQGNPGLGSGGNNPALAMMAALGNCGDLSPTQFIVINEVTTVAAAWALAPFEQDIQHIGASATNYDGTPYTSGPNQGKPSQTGLTNAFLNAGLIADTATGQTATLASNLTTEPGKIYALADAIAACINSAGGTAGDGSACGLLFSAATPSGGTAPTNTWDAVMDVVKNPGNNVAGVYGVIGSTPPFSTSLMQAPNDWTLSLTVTGGGMMAQTSTAADESPESVAIDSLGNVWVSDHSGVVSAFSPQGTPLSATGFGEANANEAYGLAIDQSDNVWVTNAEYPDYGGGPHGSLEEFSGVSSGAALGTFTFAYSRTFNYPYALAIDNTDGNILIANYYVNVAANTTNLVVFNPSANTYTAVDTGSEIGVPVAVAADTAQGAWITSNATGSAAHVASDGTVSFATDCCGSTDAVAVDSAGNAWIADSENSDANADEGGAITEIGPDNTIKQEFITGGGIYIPSHIAIDANQNLWISNLHSPDNGPSYESFSELSGINSSSPGTPLSPSAGYGLDANLLEPYGIAVDPSGDVWISNTGGESLVEFFGMATPTQTPMPITPVAP